MDYILCPKMKCGGRIHWRVCLRKSFPTFFKKFKEAYLSRSLKNV